MIDGAEERGGEGRVVGYSAVARMEELLSTTQPLEVRC